MPASHIGAVRQAADAKQVSDYNSNATWWCFCRWAKAYWLSRNSATLERVNKWRPICTHNSDSSVIIGKIKRILRTCRWYIRKILPGSSSEYRPIVSKPVNEKYYCDIDGNNTFFVFMANLSLDRRLSSSSPYRRGK